MYNLAERQHTAEGNHPIITLTVQKSGLCSFTFFPQRNVRDPVLNKIPTSHLVPTCLHFPSHHVAPFLSPSNHGHITWNKIIKSACISWSHTCQCVAAMLAIWKFWVKDECHFNDTEKIESGLWQLDCLKKLSLWGTHTIELNSWRQMSKEGF